METLIQQFIKAFGWSLINSLWQSAVIYGVLFLTLLSLPKLAARYKHNLAFGSIILMFGCFGYNFISRMIINLENQSPVSATENLASYQYFNNLPQSFSSKAEQYFPLVITFYLIGIALQLLVIGKGYKHLSHLKKNSLSNVPDGWKVISENVKSNLKIGKTIRFHLSEIVNVPLVIGYLKPVVLFPLALVNQLENDQVEAILIHELSHIRRNDFLLNLIKTAIETFLFYNPFVWMAGKFIHIEREHACDDLVLKITGKPLNYAQALLKLELLKDKSSPKYALAATGKTQNLYQRIKRITNMKTNYLNAKQQMAALTLGIACLFSIAWINPTEKKQALKNASTSSNLHIDALTADKSPAIYMDTTKKHKMKIVTIDANGKKTEYNSLKELPDSLRKDFYRDELFAGRNAFIVKSDSAFKFRDSLFQAKIYREFSSPEAQLKWKKYGEDVAKKYNSPESQAKWRKLSEDMVKEYSSPEAQAKWKKIGESLAREYSSPEAQARWKKFGDDIAKEYGSPEAQAKWRKIGEEMAEKINTPEFRAQILELKTKALKDFDGARLAPTTLKLDTIFEGSRSKMTGPDGSVFYFNNNVNRNKVKNTDEYRKLKEKFDKEVKALEEKMEKKQNPERKERLEIREKSEQKK